MKLPLFLTLLFSQSLLAGNNISVFNDDLDIFSELKSWFDNGENVSFEEVEGFYSGRCYNTQHRSTPGNSLLGIYKKEIDNDNGPAFPPFYIKRIVEGGRADEAANFYDEFEGVKSELENIWDEHSDIEDYEGTISSTLGATPDSSKLVIKRAGEYLVLGYIAQSDAKINPRLGGVFNVSSGEFWLACYYFKKLGSE